MTAKIDKRHFFLWMRNLVSSAAGEVLFKLTNAVVTIILVFQAAMRGVLRLVLTDILQFGYRGAFLQNFLIESFPVISNARLGLSTTNHLFLTLLILRKSIWLLFLPLLMVGGSTATFNRSKNVVARNLGNRISRLNNAVSLAKDAISPIDTCMGNNRSSYSYSWSFIPSSSSAILMHSSPSKLISPSFRRQSKRGFSLLKIGPLEEHSDCFKTSPFIFSRASSPISDMRLLLRNSLQVEEPVNGQKTNVTLSESGENIIKSMEEHVPQRFVATFQAFLNVYLREVQNARSVSREEAFKIIGELVEAIRTSQSYTFEPFHEAVREPLDFYAVGNNVWRPLIDFKNSKLPDIEALNRVQEWLAKGDNVILLSNHQTEPDPQVIRILFEAMGLPTLGEKLIMVAGHRVRSDPLSIPFSMGCNLLCVHSKKHLEFPPELRDHKMAENIRTMNSLQTLLTTGGKLIWVAPSGGRDRPEPLADSTSDAATVANSKKLEEHASVRHGDPVVAKFDPKTIQLYRLMAKKSGRKTHFVPMGLYSFPICPPPNTVRKDLGEARVCAFSPVGMLLGDEIDPRLATSDFAHLAENQTKRLYNVIRQHVTTSN